MTTLKSSDVADFGNGMIQWRVSFSTKFSSGKMGKDLVVMVDISKNMYDSSSTLTSKLKSGVDLKIKYALKLVAKLTAKVPKFHLILFSDQVTKVLSVSTKGEKEDLGRIMKIEATYLKDSKRRSFSLCNGLDELSKLLETGSNKAVRKSLDCVLLTTNFFDSKVGFTKSLKCLCDGISKCYVSSKFVVVNVMNQGDNRNSFFLSKIVTSFSVKGSFFTIKGIDEIRKAGSSGKKHGKKKKSFKEIIEKQIDTVVKQITSSLFKENIDAKLGFTENGVGQFISLFCRPTKSGDFESVNFLPVEFLQARDLKVQIGGSATKVSLNSGNVRSIDIKKITTSSVESALDAFCCGLSNFVFNNLSVWNDSLEGDQEFTEKIDHNLNLFTRKVFELVEKEKRKIKLVSILGFQKRIISEFYHYLGYLEGKATHRYWKISTCLVSLNALCSKTFFPLAEKGFVSVMGFVKASKKLKNLTKKKRKVELVVNDEDDFGDFTKNCISDYRKEFEKSGEFYFLGFDFFFGNGLPDYSCTKVYTDEISSNNYFFSLAYTISFKLFGSVNHMNYMINPCVPSFVIPLFVSDEHWRCIKPTFSPLLSFVVHGNFNEKRKKEMNAVSLLVMSKCMQVRGDGNDENALYESILESCLRTFGRVSFKDANSLSIAEKFNKYPNDISVRFKLKNVELFLAKLVCGIKKKRINPDDLIFQDEFFLQMVVESCRRNQHSFEVENKVEEMKKMLDIKMTEEIQFYIDFLQYEVQIKKGCSFLHTRETDMAFWKVIQKYAGVHRDSNFRKEINILLYYNGSFLNLVAQEGKVRIKCPRNIKWIRKYVSKINFSKKYKENTEAVLIFRGEMMALKLIKPIDDFVEFPELPKLEYKLVDYAVEKIQEAEEIYHKKIAPLFFFKEFVVGDFLYVPQRNNFEFIGISKKAALAMILQNMKFKDDLDFSAAILTGKVLDPFVYEDEIIQQFLEDLDYRNDIDKILNQKMKIKSLRPRTPRGKSSRGKSPRNMKAKRRKSQSRSTPRYLKL